MNSLAFRSAQARRASRALLPGIVLWLVAPVLQAAAALAPLRLEWQALPVESSAGSRPGNAATRARLTLANTGARALPASGWSIGFSCMAGVQTGPAGEGLLLEKLAGTLYRLRPAPGFAGLAAGASLVVPIQHLYAVGNPTKGIDGPYLSFDAAPESGLAISDFIVRPMPPGPEYASAAQLHARYAALQPQQPVQRPPLFPAPREWRSGGGALHWAALPAVQAPAALRTEARRARELLQGYLRAATAPVPAGPGLRLQLRSLQGEASAEAYELRVDARTGVSITAATPAGVALGLASLHELLPLGPDPDAGVTLAGITIRDAPRFAYRGLMLDVARNFQPAAQVERVLDLMARYKLNTLHLHLSDDEGWRLEIAGLPELTDYGARRGPGGADTPYLPPAQGSGADSEDPYGSGYYTRAQYLAILRHAAALHIDVIPEIEMPGHARAALKAMAWRARRRAAAGDAQPSQYRLDDPEDTSSYQSAQFYDDNVMNPALPSTYAFIGRVLDELVAMHVEAGVPLRTLHVGGDELPAQAWSGSPAVQALMRKEGLRERADVWEHFYRRVAGLLAARGIRTAGWEEIALREAGAVGARAAPDQELLPLQPIAYVWNTRSAASADGGEAGIAVRVANAGFDVVLAPAAQFYFDMQQLNSADEPGHDWAARPDLDTVFDFVPLDPSRAQPLVATRAWASEPLTAAGRVHIRGLEGTLFSELVHEPGRLDYMLMPRLLALAERAWVADPAWTTEAEPARAAALHRSDWARFAAQVGERVLPRLDAEGAGIRYRIPPPGLVREPDGVHANALLPGFALRYTLDGSAPTPRSPLVTGPIVACGTLRVAAFARDGRSSRATGLDAAEACP